MTNSTLRGMAMLVVLIPSAALAADSPNAAALADHRGDPGVTAALPGGDYQFVGTVRPRHACDIAGSNWSVGAETMDRDFTVYAHWREYLGPLGAKSARLQSGWAKTEKELGKYDWAWLDAIIPDMAAQGVEPWVCLCYGNPLYEGGGGIGLGDGLPTSPAALAAWDRYVAAVVARYGQYVRKWEIWNEPAGPLERYADLVVRTARVIRRAQPTAHIIVAAWKDVKAILDGLKRHDALQLVNEFTDHPYKYNPDETYGRAAQLRELLGSYAGHLTLRQGENGAPSEPGSFGAIAKYEWTEEKQAKWATRRLLGDLGRDIPSSYFSICDMQYPTRRNFKGLLAINDDKTVHHAKHAYFAVQRVTAIFDNTVHRVSDFAGKLDGVAKQEAYSLFGYRADNGGQLVTVWRSSDNPGARPELEYPTLTLPGMRFTDPVWVDLLSGRVYAIAAALKTERDGGSVFRRVPVYDSVALVAERGAIPLSPATK